MAEIQHTTFMSGLKNLLPQHLPKDLQAYRFGNTQWLFQLYYGKDAHIHYEVSRTSSQQGRVLEIGLHFEAKDKDLNARHLAQFQGVLLEIRGELGEEVFAEPWDRGWTKIYEAYPSEVLTKDVQAFTAERLAKFIGVMQPIYEHFAVKA